MSGWISPTCTGGIHAIIKIFLTHFLINWSDACLFASLEEPRGHGMVSSVPPTVVSWQKPFALPQIQDYIILHIII